MIYQGLLCDSWSIPVAIQLCRAEWILAAPSLLATPKLCRSTNTTPFCSLVQHVWLVQLVSSFVAFQILHSLFDFFHQRDWFPFHDLGLWCSTFISWPFVEIFAVLFPAQQSVGSGQYLSRSTPNVGLSWFKLLGLHRFHFVEKLLGFPMLVKNTVLWTLSA